MNFKNSPVIDQVGIEERVARFNTRSIKKQSKVSALKLALNMIDLTTLEGKDTEGKVIQMCNKAMQPADGINDLPTVAAVCVYPTYVAIAKKTLGNSGVKVASVSTAFPSGNSLREIKIEDTKFAVENGADEIDMVISRGTFLEGEFGVVFDEIKAVKNVCESYGNDIHLKVILETGELETLDNVRKASIIAMNAGADFIKTSTGKINPAATLPVTLVMLEAINDFYITTGKKIGMKPAGGIRTDKDALQYISLVNESLGDEWLNKKLFRIGASSVLDSLINAIISTENKI